MWKFFTTMWKCFTTWVKKHSTLIKVARVIKYSSESCPLVSHCRGYTQNNFLRMMIKILVTPYYLLKWFVLGWFAVREIPGREGLAFVLIAKNEATYIKEWLDFHIKQGVSKFIIYDNESTDNFREVLSPYIDAGIVIYDIIRGKRRQLDAYNIALRKYRKIFKYIGFIDADEFVFARNNTYGGGGTDNLAAFMDDFMAAYPNAGGIGIHWLIFGSSHHETRPAGGVLENFTMCARKDFFYNAYTKSICDPMRILVAYVHNPICRRGYDYIDENGGLIPSDHSKQIHFDNIRINHYFCKSKEEYIAIKMKRGDVNFGISQKNTTLNVFYEYDQNELVDTEILSRR